MESLLKEVWADFVTIPIVYELGFTAVRVDLTQSVTSFCWLLTKNQKYDGAGSVAFCVLY